MQRETVVNLKPERKAQNIGQNPSKAVFPINGPAGNKHHGGDEQQKFIYFDLKFAKPIFTRGNFE